MPKNKDLVEWADREVSVFDVLSDFFSIRVPREGSSYKTWCPFRYEHEDQMDKGFRTYPDTNSAYCFPLHGRLGPVRLIVIEKEWGYQRAARFLLDHYGLSDKPWRERWRELQTERSAARPVGDPQAIIVALTEALQAHPNYPAGGLSRQLSHGMEHELDILDRLLTEGADRTVVETWYAGARQRLLAELDAKEEAVGHHDRRY